MKKTVNRVLAVCLALALIAACGFGGWKVYQNYHGGAVEVYSLSDLSTTYWGDEKQTEGFVTTDQLQAEYLSETQTVEEIQVKKGQKVKKGDVLFTYDSTLTDLDLKHKQVELQQKELEIQNTQKELKVIRTYRAGVPIPGSSSGGGSGGGSSGSSGKQEKPTYEGLHLVSGTGTKKDPYCYIWKDNFQFTDDFLAAAMQGKDEAYVTFYLNGKSIPPMTPAPGDDGSGDNSNDGNGGNGGGSDDGNGGGGDSSGNGDSSGDSSGGSQPSDPDEGGGDSGSGAASEDQGDSPSEPTVEETSAKRIGPEMGNAAGTPELVLLSESSSEPDDEKKDEDGKEDESDEPYGASWTMQCQHTNVGYRYIMISMKVGGVERVVSEPLPALTKDELPQDEDDFSSWGGGGVDGIVYTSAEIASMVKEHEQSLKTLDIECRQLKLEATKLEKELNNSAVYSELDGVVTTLNDPDDLADGTPLVKVSGGGGYVIKGSISELDLNNVQLGQSVTVNDWMNDATYEGSIQEISDYPTTNSGYWGEGNTNVSYYAFTVAVKESANLEENSYVDMSYTPNDDGSGQNIYLLKSFVRSENGKSYVYQDNGGSLEKVYVSTGRDLWGSYVEITSNNLPADANLAFPYGQKVREKAPTTPGNMESLYGY